MEKTVKSKKTYNPLVSVIMNCYNGQKYLKEAIDSVYNQTYGNWEIIFFDNGSIDQSAKIANSYNSKLKYIYHEEKLTLSEARQMAVDNSNGEWLAILDQDDIWYPKKLTIQISALNNTDYILCYAGIHDIESNGKIIREYMPRYPSGYHLEKQLYQWEINNVTPLIKRSAMNDQNIHYNPRIRSSEAYNLYMRLLAKGTVCTIPIILGAWRIYPGTGTERTINSWGDERIVTLDQLKTENPGIEKQYPEAFQEAYSRGVYFQARYFMTIKKYYNARKEMYLISSVSKKYFLLYILSFFPLIWDYAHNSIFKRKASLKILGY